MSLETSFSALGMHAQLLDHLTKLGFTTPTPIQAQSIPVALTGADVLGIAQTGTGKTLAFALPMIERLAKTKGHGLILLPTRELAVQVEESVRKIASRFGARSVLLIGGVAMGPQMKALRTNPHIVIATPGRLLDHLEQKNVKVDKVSVLVFDEADRMLDMGFLPQIEQILKTVPQDRQTMLFSATMPSEIARIAATYMRQPVRIEVAPAGTTSMLIAQELIVTDKANKQMVLETLLREHKGTALVFTRTKHGAGRVARALTKEGFTAGEIHSDRSQAQRQRALDGFKRGTFRILVATDIAARGIDVSHITLVVNFDLPDNPEDYVHRIGRTGRAGREGLAVSFVQPDQMRDMQIIERLVKKTIPARAGSRDIVRGNVPVGARMSRPQRGGGGGAKRSFGGARSSQPRTSAPARAKMYSAPGASAQAMRDSAGQARPRRVHTDE